MNRHKRGRVGRYAIDGDGNNTKRAAQKDRRVTGMMHRLEHEGERWRAESTGTSHDTGGIRSAGAWFTHEATGRRPIGSLNPSDMDRPTDARLAEALQVKLSELRRKVPRVFSHRMKDGREGFEITHEMYTWMEVDPTKSARPGYIGSQKHALVDEATLRHDLRLFFAVPDDQINDVVERARRNPIADE
jgi:hypothetical protein